MPTPQTYLAYYGNLNIVAPNNADFTLGPMTVAIAGVTLNLTGATQKMQLRRAWADTSPILAFGVTANTTLVNGGAAGTVTANALAAAMLLIPPGPYLYDLVISQLAGATINWLYGTFTVAAGISR